MRILITGVGGFVGRHLAALRLKMGDEVHGIEPVETDIKGVNVHLSDITDRQALERVVASVRPEQIYHLAAIAFVPSAESDPGLVTAINYGGTFNLFEAVKDSLKEARVLFVGSSEVYGPVLTAELPITEQARLDPQNLYAATKAAAELLGGYYITSGLAITRVRPFNHTGPGQNPSFVCSNFARQIALIEKGLKDPVIEVGNLDASRDFSDVRDVVRAYSMLMDQGDLSREGPFNVCSGIAVTIKEILDRLVSISKVEVTIRRDPGRLRPSDVPVFYGDNSKLKARTGWEAEVELDSTLKDLLEYWRAR